MKFTVMFVVKYSENGLHDKVLECCKDNGLALVKEVRAKFGPIPLDKIKGGLRFPAMTNLVIELSEEDAACIPHFEKNSNVVVRVPRNAFNSLVETHFVVQRNMLGRVKKVIVTYVVPDNKVLEWWGAKNYALDCT